MLVSPEDESEDDKSIAGKVDMAMRTVAEFRNIVQGDATIGLTTVWLDRNPHCYHLCRSNGLQNSCFVWWAIYAVRYNN